MLAVWWQTCISVNLLAILYIMIHIIYCKNIVYYRDDLIFSYPSPLLSTSSLFCACVGGVLFHDGFPAGSIPCCTGHRWCEVAVAELREVSMQQQTLQEKVLLQAQFRRCSCQTHVLHLSGYPEEGCQSCSPAAV